MKNDRAKRLLNSCFGLGQLPVAPGTFGSLPSAIVFFLMKHFTPADFAVTAAVMICIALLASTCCVRFAAASIEAAGSKDPSEMVLDEMAGAAVTFLGSFGMTAGSAVIVTITGFALFRIFDITKPWPCRKLEKLPMGWGILADDLMAGVYAAVVLQVCVRLWFS